MRSISIYQRKGFLYLCPSVYTEAGVGILSGPCMALSVASSTAGEVGEAALQTLERSGAIVPHPEDWTRLPPSPVLATAGVKSWTTFSRRARCLGMLEHEGELILTPTRREGATGFPPLSDQKTRLPAEPRPTSTALGEAILEAMTRCR